MSEIKFKTQPLNSAEMTAEVVLAQASELKWDGVIVLGFLNKDHIAENQRLENDGPVVALKISSELTHVGKAYLGKFYDIHFTQEMLMGARPIVAHEIQPKGPTE